MMHKKILFAIILSVIAFRVMPVFSEAGDVTDKSSQICYTLISSKELSHVNELLRESINNLFPGAKEAYLEYDSPEAKQYIKELSIEFVPFVIYDNSVSTADIFFHMVRNNMIDKVQGYYIIPAGQLKSGEIMFLNRKREPSVLYIYAMGFCPYSREAEASIIDLIKRGGLDIDIFIKYLVSYTEFGMSSPRGPDEIRENIRQIIIQKYYPDKFSDYLSSLHSKKPEDILKELDIPADEIEGKKEEAIEILKADYEEAQSLGIHRSPAFLWENIYLVPAIDGLKQHSPFNVKKNPAKAVKK
jgi:hypothetical protein